MVSKKKIAIIVTSVVLALAIIIGSAFAIWWFTDDSPARRKKKKVIVVKQYPSSDTQSSDDNGNVDNTYEEDEEYYESVKRELYQKTQNSVVEYVPEYKVTYEKWDGPKGYVIVIAEGNKYSKQAAEKIRDYFEKQAGVKLEIVTDKQKEQKKEILVGNTNRYASKLGENEYAVKISGDKLIFEGGHYVMLGKAVDWFVIKEHIDGKVVTLTGKTKDFAAKKEGGYEYVWGDEFSGAAIDNTKWVFANRMAGSALLETRTDKAVASVGQDNLKLRAIRSYRKENPVAQYATMQSLNTMKTMSFMYGYLEMSARVPFISGAWPSLWANSNGALNNKKTTPYTIEVDIFEVFSSFDTLTPNIHKWRGQGTHSQYNTDNKVDGERVAATPYVFENTDNLVNEYHIYGFKWNEKEMIMSVDGKDYMTFDLTKNFDNMDDMEGFKVPISLLINNHMFTSDTEAIDGSSVVNNLDLPFEYDIDWIRLYQKPNEGVLNIAE